MKLASFLAESSAPTKASLTGAGVARAVLGRAGAGTWRLRMRGGGDGHAGDLRRKGRRWDEDGGGCAEDRRWITRAVLGLGDRGALATADRAGRAASWTRADGR